MLQGTEKSLIMLISLSANKLKRTAVDLKERNGWLQLTTWMTLLAWTKNGYFDQIGQGYLARKGGGGCWLCNMDQVISFC